MSDEIGFPDAYNRDVTINAPLDIRRVRTRAGVDLALQFEGPHHLDRCACHSVVLRKITEMITVLGANRWVRCIFGRRLRHHNVVGSADRSIDASSDCPGNKRARPSL